MSGLSIIVPLLNEFKALPDLVEALARVEAEQVIIVDGGSDDGSAKWLERHWQNAADKLLLKQSAGRAKQMNAGAALATQPLLLFLHADTVLPSNAKVLLLNQANSSQNNRSFWGRFDVRFDDNNFVMAVIAFLINLRSRISGVATGDQAIFMSADLFNSIDGYDDLSLMEDIAISKKLRRHVRPICLHETVTTSARRWQSDGIVRTVLTMWWYRLLFACGVSPNRFSKRYRDVR